MLSRDDIEVRVTCEDEFDFDSNLIRKCVIDSLTKHPFLGHEVVLAGRVHIEVIVGRSVDNSQIDHARYADKGLIRLELHKMDFNLVGGGCMEFSEDLLRRLLLHEFGHFIDARLDSRFGYEDKRRPTHKSMRRAFFELWDAFIDGRLADHAPKTREQREHEARVPCEFIGRAWQGEYSTFDALLAVAQGLEGGEP